MAHEITAGVNRLKLDKDPEIAIDDDESCLDCSDNESMFDMFTGDCNELRVEQSANEEGLTDSDDSWEGVEEFEYAQYDKELRSVGQEFVEVKRNMPSQLTDQTPKDIRILNAEATQPYTWKPLHDEQAIRVLDLLPAEHPNEPLQAQMLESGRINYQAVSHSCDSIYQRTSDSVSMPCDGALLPMSPAVYDMLKKVRNQLDRGRWTEYNIRPCIWVDAVCIDRESRDGENRCAARTGDIFRNAQGSIIWLGDANIQKGDKVMTGSEHATVPDTANKLKDNLSKYELAGLLRHPWFNQRSAIQEFVSQKRRTVLLGDEAIKFDAFVALINHHRLLSQAGIFREAECFDSFRPYGWLLSTLFRWRGTKSTSKTNTPTLDELVVPLIPLSCGCTAAGCKSRCGVTHCGLKHYISYLSEDKPVEERLTQLTARFARVDIVAVLALACVYGQKSNREREVTVRLPSWVPDWGIAHDKQIPGSQLHLYLERCFSLEGFLFSDHAQLGYTFDFRLETAIWMHADRQAMLSEYQPPKAEDQGKGILRITGWLLERCQPESQVPNIDWNRVTRRAGVQGGGMGMDLALQYRSKEIAERKHRQDRVQIVRGEWPVLEGEDVILFIPGRQLMFVLKPTSKGYYTLASMVHRRFAIEQHRFVLMRPFETVWAYGHLGRQPHEVCLV